MIIVAGPPGSGKSSIFPVDSFGVAYFNADDRAAELNGGSYVGISRQIRQAVNQDFEAFVAGCIDKRTSFAIETTLRCAVTFEQGRLARADAGGHSASEMTLRRIHKSSLENLGRAVAEMDELWVYDNSAAGGPPKLVMEAVVHAPPNCARIALATGTSADWAGGNACPTNDYLLALPALSITALAW